MGSTAKGGAIGSGLGLVAGGIAGIETGPGAIATAYAGAQILGPPSAAVGYSVGLFTCMSRTGPGGGGDFRPKSRGAQEREQRNLNEITRKFNIDRHAFGDFVEEEKAIEGRGSSSEYTYRELEGLVSKYKAAGGR